MPPREVPFNNDYLYMSSGSDEDKPSMIKSVNRSQSQGLLVMTATDREALKNYTKWNDHDLKSK